MGSAACYHLASRGAAVIGIDRFEVPHAHGSSGGESRLIRMCYFEHPDYVPLLRRAYEGWRQLSAEAGAPILEVTGGLFIGAEDSALVAGSRRAALEHGLAHEMLSSVELRRRFPPFAIAKGMEALYEPTAGLVHPELAIAAQVRLAAAHGARLSMREQVVGWSAGAAGVRVETNRRTIRAESLLLCAGAWTPTLAPALAPSLHVTRQVLVWVAPDDPGPFARGSSPSWAVEHDGGDFHYGFPILDPRRGLKVGRHVPGPVVDPDSMPREPAPGDEDSVLEFIGRYLPGARGPVRELSVCTYTNSPDRHFVLDRLPGYGHVYVACGFSGHGFKFAPVIGEALADLALMGTTRLPVSFLRLERFA